VTQWYGRSFATVKEGERVVTIASESTTGIVGPKHLISLWKLNHQIPRHLTNLQSPINQ
jgi:hypothetical protein